jgi:tetratricopeptide (TPR) repeat protein
VPVLQINQEPGGAPHRYRISVRATEIPDRAALNFDTDIEFELTPENGERIRWYLEDYLQFDEEPAPQIAAGVEAFMAQCGEELFRKIFEGSKAAIKLWWNLEPYLSNTRIEIAAGVAEATAIPWELIRNPDSKTFLALSAAAFVRSQRGGRTVLAPETEAAKVRILLVICRPKGGEDVPFRSVAGRLVTRLSDDARDAFDIHVLRPPTFEQLAKTLRLAKERNAPYHIVHFDGHGVYADPRNLRDSGDVINRLKHDSSDSSAHGYLVFEDPDSENNSQFVNGFRLGGLLGDSGVPVLVLNACQSAFAEARIKPATENPADAREEVEAYGSLAQAVMDAGAAGIVAMRYSVYVVTAAQFMAELYGALARGHRLGEAVTSARRNMHDQPDRQIAYESRPLQDWSVPVVWERAPLRLWPEKSGATPPRIFLEGRAASTPGALDEALPARPDAGFYGRDETLYALDRAFDTHPIVLLHAYAGSGKTSTAVEFARWYALTGGVAGPVLFTSFERHLPLPRVLDKIGQVFGEALAANGILWDTIIDQAARGRIVLQLLQQIPVLWIWDDVEPITGFPTGTKSEWSVEEQQELRTFLNAARDTQAKFLLISRRDEDAWLGRLPRRVEMPPMPMQERLQLASAIVERRGGRLSELPDLTPLLRFTRGDPLTILVTVGEALRAGIYTASQLEKFLAVLQSGAADFADEKAEGRSKSLGASLSYGFGASFTEEERRALALLHLFQGVVNVKAVELMCNPEAEWALETVRLTSDRGTVLFDRAAEIGLLEASGGGYYRIHPALPWYFRRMFEHYFPETSGDAERARRAFATVIGALGEFYQEQYDEGRHEALSVLTAEEDNLLSAWRLARKSRLWDCVISTMQGLRVLYDSTGRSGTWRQLVDETTPEFIDRSTDGPLAGREKEWGQVIEYRVHLARDNRNWPEAERLQRSRIDWDRVQAAKAADLDADPHKRALARSLFQLAEIQRGQRDPGCIATYIEALELARAINDSAAQSYIALSLGNASLSITDPPDLDNAELWYRRSLDLAAPGDNPMRARILGQLGLVAYKHFNDAKAADRPATELGRYIAEAAQYYSQSLEMAPATAVDHLAATHNQLGNVYQDAGGTDRALMHFRQGIRYAEMAGDTFGAGQTRFNVALTLLRARRLSEARLYAEAALNDFRTFGDRAVSEIERTEKLVSFIGAGDD